MDGFVGQTGAAGHAGLSLSDILQQSRKLTNQLGRDSDLPSIQLGIDQIESQSRKLASKSVRNGNPAADARAYVPVLTQSLPACEWWHRCRPALQCDPAHKHCEYL